jgi:hypothetical protein
MDPDTYQILFRAMGEKSNIKLVNTYRGVPITANGHIIELHGNEARVETTGLQIICIRSQKFSYLNFGSFIYHVHIANSDLGNETIDFMDFEINHRIIGLRKFIRVEPKVPINAKMTSPRFNTGDHSQDKWFNSAMIDLSIHGAAIHLHSLILKQTPVYIDDSAKLKFDLTIPSTETTFQAEIKAKIRNITPFDENTMRIGLEIFPDSLTENILTAFVANLQKSIILELKDRLEKERPVDTV